MLQKIKTFTAAIAISAMSLTSQAQLKTPTASPLQTLKQGFALSEIGLEYYRPSAKGRVIFGDVVPFGKIWRTGANGSTKITFGEDVKVEGQNVAAGTYALYSVPNKDSWELMLYKDLTLGGNTGDYKKENELIRFTVKPAMLTEKVETFEVNVANITSNTANIELRWENTRVAFAVVADIDTKIMKNIEKNVINDSRPYYQAASYYYENNKDLKLALEWADKAVSQNPKAYWVLLLKAKIQAKANDKKGAATTAAQVVTIAKEEQDDAYVKMAEQIIADSKK
jgi:hypothetical protein